MGLTVLEALDTWADPFHWLVAKETDGESLDKSTIVVMAGRVMAFLTFTSQESLQGYAILGTVFVILNKRNIQLLCVNMGPKTRK